MSDVTQILAAMEQGDPHAAEQLLPLVYDELRKLAAAKLAFEKPGQTLQATALVHEAFLRLVATPRQRADQDASRWDGRGHFFAAAAEAMRRILVENARRKGRVKHGGEMIREELVDVPVSGSDVH
jgi:RNA polymerase sigma factor (TIGR02999 family)